MRVYWKCQFGPVLPRSVPLRTMRSGSARTMSACFPISLRACARSSSFTSAGNGNSAMSCSLIGGGDGSLSLGWRDRASGLRDLSSRELRAMAYVITEPCVNVKDASCVDVCPVDCIYTTDADNMYFIHPDECIDCGACESVCPVSAIFPEDAVPDKWKNYIEINKVYFNK